MKFFTYITVFISLIYCYTTNSSQIARISLSELCINSNLIVAAQVTNVVKNKNLDLITIKIDYFLKGKTPNNVYNLSLCSRDTLKGFDPEISKDDTGIFFLKYDSSENKIKKAYWGSIATFPKNNFYSSRNSSSKDNRLQIWSNYRKQKNQITNINDYKKGFLQGYSSTPALVDNSPDFNLGHSDGMQAKMNKTP